MLPRLARKCCPWLVALIVAVSLYDTTLIVLFQETIDSMEENPIGVWLLGLDQGNVEIFVRAKLAGTLVVATVLVALYRIRSWTAIPVTTSVAACQTALLAYLTLA